jgi:hypothetical protein
MRPPAKKLIKSGALGFRVIHFVVVPAAAPVNLGLIARAWWESKPGTADCADSLAVVGAK